MATNWLDEDEQATWRAFLPMFATVDRALDQQLQRDSAMPHTYYMLLAMLSEAPRGAARMSTLADLTSSSQSRVSHAVARLEDRGWVRRDPDRTDGRGTVAALTAAGRRALREAAPGHVAAVRAALFDRLTPAQVRQLRRIAEAVTGAGEGSRPGG